MKPKLLLLLVCALLIKTQTFSQSIDSILYEDKIEKQWQNNMLVVLHNDDQCHNTEKLVKVWDVAAKQWINNSQTFVKYNVAGKTDEVQRQYWDTNSQQWVNISKTAYAYTNNYKSRVITAQRWNSETGAWENNQRITENLNEFDYPLYSLYEGYIDNAWQNLAQDFYQYNSDNQQTYFRIESWQNNAWINFNKTNYINSDAVSALGMGYYWDVPTSAWIKATRMSIEYVPHTNIQAKYVVQDFFRPLNAWQNSLRNIADFSNNLFTKGKSDIWISDSAKWVTINKSEQDYYPDGSVHHFAFKFLNTATNTWDLIQKTTYTHNGCLLSAKIASTTTKKEVTANKQTGGRLVFVKEAEDNKNGNEISLDVSINHGDKAMVSSDYNVVITPKPKVSAALQKTAIPSVTVPATRINISPNPASTYVNIYSQAAMKQIQIISTTGQLLKTATPNATSFKLQVSSLVSGEYFLRIKTDAGIYNEKFIKK